MTIKLGLIGTNGSGKSAASAHLVEKGFVWISLSDVVRQAVVAAGLHETREILIATANRLKDERGQDFLARAALAQAQSVDGPVVFDSIRNVAEVQYLADNGVHMIGVDAPQALRFSRVCVRARAGDAMDFETFARLDDAENTGKSSGQNIYEAMKVCQYRLINDGDLGDFLNQIDFVVREVDHFRRIAT